MSRTGTSFCKGRKSMAFEVPSSNLFLLILLVLVVRGSESRKMSEKYANNLELPSGNDEIKDGMSQVDPSEMIFFTLKDMKVGQKMPVYFPKKDPSSSPRLLAREEADSIAFSSKELSKLLKFFSFTKDSPQARAMEYTLSMCEIEPIKGETKFCATSLESMLDFTRTAFGDESFSVVRTIFLTKSSTTLQNYTILEVPKEILAPKMVACHTMPYPYAVYYCHHQKGENTVYKILLGGENGDKVEAVAVCHMDTSHWSRDHASFRVLRIEPGTLPVCHFFPSDHLVWFPTPTSD